MRTPCLVVALAALTLAHSTASPTPTLTTSIIPIPTLPGPTQPSRTPAANSTGFGPWTIRNLTIFERAPDSATLSYVDLAFEDADPTFGLAAHCATVASTSGSRDLVRAGDGKVYVPCDDDAVAVAYEPEAGAVSVSMAHAAYDSLPASAAYGTAKMAAAPADNGCGTLTQLSEMAVPVDSVNAI